MADNVVVNPGSGGATFATDDIGGVQYPRGKIVFGVDGAAVDVSATNPLPVVIGDGTRQASVRDTGASDSLNVAIVDASGNQITTFGGGVQYAEGATAATITGTAMLWEDTGDTLRPVSAAKPLPVGDAGGSLTVDAPVGTPVFVRLSDGTAAITNLPVDTELPAAAALADTMANPTAPAVGSFGLVWDGTDWARQIESVAGLNTTGTGLPSNAMAAQFDDTATTAVTENRFAHLRIDSSRQLRVRVDAASLGADSQSAHVYTRPRSTTTISVSGQVSVGTTSTQITPSESTRRSLLIVNHGTTDVFLGPSGVTTTTGLLLKGYPGSNVVLDTSAAVFGIVASGNQTVSPMSLLE